MSKRKPGIYLCVDQDGWTKGMQLSIGDENGGYRLHGPKYNGSSKSLIEHLITERDIAEIRGYLNQAEKLLKVAP